MQSFVGTRITRVSCRGSHALATTSTGLLYTWGRGDEGQLGHGNRESSSTPKIVDSFAKENCPIVKIACGRSHSVAVNNDGSVFTWGCGDDGQLGRGDTRSICEPHRITAFDGQRIATVECGSRHTLALDSMGRVYSWGWAIYGQIGIGDRNNQLEPVAIPIFVDRQVLRICCGFRHNFAVLKHIRRHSVDTITVSKICESENFVDVWGWGWYSYQNSYFALIFNC